MEQLFKSLPNILRSVGTDTSTDEAIAFAAWRRCAGEALGARTRPLQFFEKRLVVAVADETWRRHLEDLGAQMVARLNAELGDGSLRFIEFRVDPSAVPTRRSGPEPENVVNDPEMDSAAAAITDETLREGFLQTASSCLNKTKNGR
jgi:hypothetical protein